MKNLLKKIIPRSFVEFIFLSSWLIKGCPLPPPHIFKQLVIKYYQKRYKILYFIETGTYLGDMVNAVRNNFIQIYSIELNRELYENAVNKFFNKNNIKIIWGDSGKELLKIVPEIKNKTIFWLDGHYSGGITSKGEKVSPILEELDIILNSKLKHIILIDDARLFVGQDDYPSLPFLKDYINLKRANSKIIVKNDIIRVFLS